MARHNISGYLYFILPEAGVLTYNYAPASQANCTAHHLSPERYIVAWHECYIALLMKVRKVRNEISVLTTLLRNFYQLYSFTNEQWSRSQLSQLWSVLVGIIYGMCHTIGTMSKPSTRDRKSTRLNSSHLVISYAVFCLKKKKQNKKKNFWFFL